ncbi:MAG: iron chelate uptake ABC transporter family permease subunit [Chloroflexi bacterium]|nr:iron chelate uptake ABC transporter family permease subunit [Chloroflexota bacterium]
MRRYRLATVLALLGATLVTAMLLGTAFGAVAISPWTFFKMSLGKLGLSFSGWSAAEETILFSLRLPRVVGAALVGAALATAGVLFQGLLRNPMADPYIIGTSAGAALGAAVALILPLEVALYGFGLAPLLAFFGALGAVMVVYNLARIGGRTPIVSVLLAGFAVSSLLFAAIALLMTLNDRLQLKVRAVFAFLMGGVSVQDWRQIAIVAPLILGGILLARLYAYRLNAFSLGEEGAAYLGIEVERDKLVLLAIGSLLTAAAVSLGGLIGFVGLVVPHALRLVLGPDHRLLLPAAALGGAAFLVLSDLLARSLLPPTEIPVGIITALIGAPVFIYLLRRHRQEYAF